MLDNSNQHITESWLVTSLTQAEAEEAHDSTLHKNVFFKDLKKCNL